MTTEMLLLADLLAKLVLPAVSDAEFYRLLFRNRIQHHYFYYAEKSVSV
jgi:hypothetical protein